MRRFLPKTKIEETFEQANFMGYFTTTIDELLEKTISRWKSPVTTNDKIDFKL